ncbi:MAG: redoxin domain-containing protein [Candidatus Eremiobacteraeota bacterium]|nr:redoxin domain-containing protein [Candidatus Eremiobacteraeota bacterium]
MSRALLVLGAFGAIALAGVRPVAVRGDAVAIGQTAPSFIIDTLDGRQISSDFNGRPAYINVFATWCPPCRRELPAVLDQAKQYRDRIVFVFVDEQETPTAVKNFAASVGIATGVAVDRGQFAATFAVGGLPWNIFIDRHGIVQYIYRGRIPNDVLDTELSKLASS